MVNTMSIKHQKALDLSYKIGRECAFSFMSDPDLANVSFESMLGILTAGWYVNNLYSVLNIYAPVMKKYVATSEKNVEDILPRSSQWLDRFQQGIKDEFFFRNPDNKKK